MSNILIGAHRGAMCYAPENTLPAFEIAIEQGTYRIECDIRRTSDAELILLHDATLDRTTSGKGPVAGMTLAEVRNFKCGKDVEIPTFKEALRCAKGRVKLLVELKDSGIANQAIEEINSEGMADDCTIISFDEENLRTARNTAPEIDRGFFHIKPGSLTRKSHRGIRPAAVGCLAGCCNPRAYFGGQKTGITRSLWLSRSVHL